MLKNKKKGYGCIRKSLEFLIKKNQYTELTYIGHKMENKFRFHFWPNNMFWNIKNLNISWQNNIHNKTEHNVINLFVSINLKYKNTSMSLKMHTHFLLTLKRVFVSNARFSAFQWIIWSKSCMHVMSLAFYYRLSK